MFGDMVIDLFTGATTGAALQDGQGALEYALIIIALLVVIYLAYKYAAAQIGSVASTFVYSSLHGVQGG